MQVCIHDIEIRLLKEMPKIKLYENLRNDNGYRKWAIIINSRTCVFKFVFFSFPYKILSSLIHILRIFHSNGIKASNVKWPGLRVCPLSSIYWLVN